MPVAAISCRAAAILVLLGKIALYLNEAFGSNTDGVNPLVIALVLIPLTTSAKRESAQKLVEPDNTDSIE